MRRAAVRLLVIALLCAPPATSDAKGPKRAPAAEAPIPALPLAVAVATEDTPDGPRPVRDASWIDAQVAAAVRIFAPHAVTFQVASRRTLPPRFAYLETRTDRDALAAERAKSAVNVFVVASLRDVDDPALLRQGVHWRVRKDPAKHFVIVAAAAAPTTLAHELGHFLGNPHSAVVDNLMSYDRTGDDAVFLDALQGKKARRAARFYFATKEVLPLP